jgi:hypothetical protein
VNTRTKATKGTAQRSKMTGRQKSESSLEEQLTFGGAPDDDDIPF